VSVKKCFVDTNIFLRHLLDDNLPLTKKASEIFESGVWGKIILYSSMVVYLEIYWVLKNQYGYKEANLKAVMLMALKLDVDFNDREVFVSAVKHMDRFNYDLEDAINFYVAKELKVDDFKTFDQKLLRKFNK